MLSAPSTKDEVIRQFFIANRGLFKTQQNMHLDLKAANQFDVEDGEMAEVFDKRGRSSKEYGPLFSGEFRPYIPSESIIEKFYEKAEEFQASDPSYVNPFEAASPVIAEMIEAFQGADLSKGWNFDLSDFGIEEVPAQPTSTDPFRSQLQTPMPAQEVIQTAAVQAPGVMNQGLTPTENALLSEEEKQITLRNRGMV